MRRLWFRNPSVDNSGVSGFYQFGANNSDAMKARQYFGMGLTGFGLVPGRPDDSMGFGLALTWLNDDPQGATSSSQTSTKKNPLPMRLQPVDVPVVLSDATREGDLLPAGDHLHPHPWHESRNPRGCRRHDAAHRPLLSGQRRAIRSRSPSAVLCKCNNCLTCRSLRVITRIVVARFGLGTGRELYCSQPEGEPLKN